MNKQAIVLILVVVVGMFILQGAHGSIYHSYQSGSCHCRRFCYRGETDRGSCYDWLCDRGTGMMCCRDDEGDSTLGYHNSDDCKCRRFCFRREYKDGYCYCSGYGRIAQKCCRQKEQKSDDSRNVQRFRVTRPTFSWGFK